MISSSGIKRGVAASAISALAVAGLPFLANSASAAHESSLDVTSRDGAAFDEDEFDYTLTGPGANNGAEESDIVGQLNDADGNPIAGGSRQVDYRWVVTPFDGSPAAADSLQNDEGTVFTDDEGKFSIPRPAVADDDGTWELFVTLVDTDGAGTQVGIAESKELTVKSGDSTLAYDEASPEQAQSGTSETVSGSLKLADGTGLAGRLVDVNYAGGNATIQESSGTANDGIVTTDANGNWSVVVNDPAASPQPEEEGTVTAETADQTETDANNDTAVGNPDDTDNPDESAGAQTVQFIQSEAPATIAISPSAGTDTAGEVRDYTVNVKNAEGDDLNNTEVTLTTDHGYFTDGVPQGAVGGDAGVYDNDGQSITVTTDGSGNASFSVSIGRDAGFDDDGLVEAIITATSGSASDTEDQDWTSENPLNGGAVDLVFSEEQESGVLPKAPVEDRVYFDVVATDQFDNVVGGASVDITDNTGDAEVSDDNITTDYDDNGDFFASAGEQVDQTITATWVTDTQVLVADDNTDTDTAPQTAEGPDETLTDAETVNWYEVDYANSTYTMTHSGDDVQPVGSVVTFTYTATDQNGEEISALAVGFFRSGPDEQQDGSQNQDAEFLGQDGRITYTFSGDEPGTAVVTALGTLNGDEVPEARQTGSVTFGAGGGGNGDQIEIDVRLTGKNNGGNPDRLLADAPRRAAGATVKLFRFKGDSKKDLIRTAVLNDRGNKRFKVRDLNGRDVTQYIVKVMRTEDTLKARSNRRKMR